MNDTNKTTPPEEKTINNTEPKQTEQKTSELEVVKPAEIDKSGQLILTNKHIELIKTQIAKEATQQEFELFLMMAYRTRLDPLMNQLYFIKYGQGDRQKVSYVTSIDGYRIIAARTGEFAGTDEPKYEYDKKGFVSHCTVTVYRLVQGIRVGFTAKVKFTEYSTGKNLWTSKPETMIAKVAEAHALRKAFPQDLSGIYTQDEMDQATSTSAGQKKPLPMTLDQATEIKQLAESKEYDKDKMADYIRTTYKVEKVKGLNRAQADHLIKELKKLKDKPVVEAVGEETQETEQSFEEFAQSQIPEGEAPMSTEEAAEIAQNVADAMT